MKSALARFGSVLAWDFILQARHYFWVTGIVVTLVWIFVLQLVLRENSLYWIPVLIFGVLATNGALSDPEPFTAPFLMLCAMTLISFVIAPIAGAFALKMALD